MEKILFVSTHFPSSLGGVRRLHRNLIDFSKFFQVHFIRIVLPREEKKATLSLPAGIIYSEVRAQKTKFDTAAFLLPIYCRRIMLLKSAEKEIQDYISANGIVAVNVHTADTCLALRNLNAKVKVAEILDSFENYYSSKHAATRTLSTLLFSALAHFLSKAEQRELGRHYDLLAFVSEEDKKTSVLAQEKLVACEGREPPLKTQNFSRPTDVVLFGRWDHPPNRDGLKKIAPDLGRINGNVLIIGPNLPAALCLPKNVHAAGFVDDIEKTLSNSKICLIPVWYGAGLQNKVFDALRHGCKTISTAFTQKTFEEDGLSSNAISYSDDLISATNSALENYCEKDAKSSYAAYNEFFKLAEKKQLAYAQKVKELAQAKA